MFDSEDDRQQQGSNEQRQRQQQQEESDMRGGEVRAGSRSYVVEIPSRFGPDFLPTGGSFFCSVPALGGAKAVVV